MTQALSIQGLKKVYNNGFEALKGIDLVVEQGDFFALLGPNGAGKSTTIGVVCSLVSTDDSCSPAIDVVASDFWLLMLTPRSPRFNTKLISRG